MWLRQASSYRCSRRPSRNIRTTAHSMQRSARSPYLPARRTGFSSPFYAIGRYEWSLVLSRWWGESESWSRARRTATQPGELQLLELQMLFARMQSGHCVVWTQGDSLIYRPELASSKMLLNSRSFDYAPERAFGFYVPPPASLLTLPPSNFYTCLCRAQNRHRLGPIPGQA